VSIAVAADVDVPELDRSWIRLVLFEKGIDGWVDLSPDPISRPRIGAVYAEQVTASYQCWKWLTERAGGDVDAPPPDGPVPAAIAAMTAAPSWTALMCSLAVTARAQGILLDGVLAAGDENVRRTFAKSRRDFAGHAALGYYELRTGARIDAEEARSVAAAVVPATAAWLRAIDARYEGVWSNAVTPLLAELHLP
jgi:hypothetical protein